LHPPRRLRKHLRAAADRGVDVTIITNSKESNNFVATYYAGLNYYRELIEAGIDIYEYDGPETLHAKTMLVDGELEVVGSYNLDPRSAVEHSEAMVLLRDARAIEQLKKATDTMLGNASKASSRISQVERIKANAHRVAERWL
jgi:putative cardiolipin synthase